MKKIGRKIITQNLKKYGKKTKLNNIVPTTIIIIIKAFFLLIIILYSIVGRITSRKYYCIHLLGQTKKMKMTSPKEIYNQKGRKTTLKLAQILSVEKLPNLKWRKESGCHIRIF